MKEEKEINYTKLKVTCYQFELILDEYGMSKAEYVRLRGEHTRSWFYCVLRKRKYLRQSDLEPFVQEVGYSAARNLFKKYAETWDEERD
jgi:hypothetical protein